MSSLYLCICLCLYHSISRSISTSISISISISTSISTSTSTSISISTYLPTYLSIYLSLSIYICIYLSKRFALSSRWYSNPKPTLNQTRIYSTPTLHKEILNQHDDNIQWNYCASLCLNLHSTCFQGACRVVYTPWVSLSTQHLACENGCFQSALGGRRCPPLPPIPPRPFFLKSKFKLAHFSIH